MYRSPGLESQELLALYGGESSDHYVLRDEDCTSEECDLDWEGSEEGKGSRGVRSSVSLEIHGLQREQHIRFSNREYYRRLEELKSTHLRNMAELERMYVSQGRGWRPEEEEEEEEEEEGEAGGLGRGGGLVVRRSVSSCSARKLQRINSQEELDFHETSSGSDQSELCGEDGPGEPGPRRRPPGRGRAFGREMQLTAQEHFWLRPKAAVAKPQGSSSRPAGVGVGVGARPGAKVTVPRPFQMMLREEERRRQKVRTRSEVELENSLLRRELEELRECQRKFRASPAPAHIHLPLYQIISRRSGRPAPPPRPRGREPRRGDPTAPRSSSTSSSSSQQPFNFLERERRKREARILEELGGPGQREEREAFRARPLPSSVYGARTGPRAGPSDPSPDARGPQRPQRRPTSRPVKRQMELSIELVREKEWSELSDKSDSV